MVLTNDDSSLFVNFARIAEQVGSTTKRLQKAVFLRDYFETLNDHDLPLAARFFAGQAFSSADQRTTNIGGSALRNAVSSISETELDRIRELEVKLGDTGDVAATVFTNQTPTNYTLHDIAGFLAQIAETSGTKAKTQLLTDFLRPASNLEAKYIVKILTGDLRIGLLEGAVEDGLARMFDTPSPKCNGQIC
jgi:DNA ligase-1